MKSNKSCLFTINVGSSGIKFSMYKSDGVLIPSFYGAIENIGIKNTTFSFTDTLSNEKTTRPVKANDHEEAAKYLIDWLELRDDFNSVKAIGHRIVHGMKHTAPEKINNKLLAELKQISAYDPEHLPGEIILIEVFAKRYPKLLQVACFDTAFHTTMPLIARLLPIPAKYFTKGIQRYGFHGLSYTYLLQQLKHIAGKETANGKIIMAHLGNGASITAIENGESIDTSMGFTPTAGLVMGSRTGDLDPGVAWYFMQVEKLTPKEFNHLINHESGLLGISKTSSDMRELIKNKNSNTDAANAFDLFCYQIKKFIGAYAAALEGLDTLVFSGGIGEHSPEVRSQVCDGLEFLGIELNEIKNMNNDAVISSDTSKVTVYVIPTNEQLMIAKLVCDVLASGKKTA
ncbi:MAG TPA: acetate/propionate family kinase [Panacibacter sp.]|nr:acetate/propionate family kinase [Panacibacter sp.]